MNNVFRDGWDATPLNEIRAHVEAASTEPPFLLIMDLVQLLDGILQSQVLSLFFFFFFSLSPNTPIPPPPPSFFFKSNFKLSPQNLFLCVFLLAPEKVWPDVRSSEILSIVNSGIEKIADFEVRNVLNKFIQNLEADFEKVIPPPFFFIGRLNPQKICAEIGLEIESQTSTSKTAVDLDEIASVMDETTPQVNSLLFKTRIISAIDSTIEYYTQLSKVESEFNHQKNFVSDSEKNISTLKTALETFSSIDEITDISLEMELDSIAIVPNIQNIDSFFEPYISASPIYLENCFELLKSIYSFLREPSSCTRILSSIIDANKTTLFHNRLCELLLMNTAILSTDIMHSYLNSSESLCRSCNPPKSRPQSHNVKLTCLIFSKLFKLDIIKPINFVIELSSFCLSYIYTNEAVSLYSFLTENNFAPQ
ncbi:hypothetical protein AYI68_g6274 [Smittium mucronatum]|uniref:Uncharacterized protein n=1 Tax=Smittium mucronatum TaxID=133383 RepID=A0A1R0GRX3_9FUNG|nr:hypothetical protein AYI68_g6274 [Smittium mucronatum]